MPTPYEKEEFLKQESLRQKAVERKLNIIPCFSYWADICGFGNTLSKANWNIKDINDSGILSILSDVYTMYSNVRLHGVDPMPYDVSLILNDGIAKSIDLNHIDLLDANMFVFFIRDLIFTHWHLLENTRKYDLSIRSVISIGERTEYSISTMTGNSILSHDEKKISDFGKKMLETTYVYNPVKFQMNTAFAKAFTIESMGTKYGIQIGGFYIDTNFFSVFDKVKGLSIEKEVDKFNLILNGIKVISLSCEDEFSIDCKGIKVGVNRIRNMHIYKELDGDDVIVDLIDLEKNG